MHSAKLFRKKTHCTGWRIRTTNTNQTDTPELVNPKKVKPRIKEDDINFKSEPSETMRRHAQSCIHMKSNMNERMDEQQTNERTLMSIDNQ